MNIALLIYFMLSGFLGAYLSYAGHSINTLNYWVLMLTPHAMALSFALSKD